MTPFENKTLLLRLDKVQEDLRESGVFEERKIDTSRERSFSFVTYCIQRFLDNFTINETIEFITDAKNDQSIDIFHINDDNDVCEINLFQVKFKEKNLNATITEKEVSFFLEKVQELIIDGNTNDLPMNEHLRAQYQKFQEIFEHNKEIIVNIHLVTNGGDIGLQEKKTLEKFVKKFKPTIKKFCVHNSYGFFLDDESSVVEEIKIPISNNANISTNEEVPAYVVNIQAFHLAKLYQKFEESILEKNVRKLLKSKTNKEIEKSLLTNPKLFWHKNNGLSIVCRRAEITPINGMKNITLENPSIVNGGQTTKTIYNLFSNRDEDNEEEMQPFYDTQILVRVYQTTDEEIISNIVYGTNNQNKITAADLKSLHPNVKKIKLFFKENGVLLQTKRDSEFKAEISLEYLLQLYWSIFAQEPHSAKRSKTKLIENHFDEVFDKEDNATDLLASYNLCKYISSKLKDYKGADDIKRHGLFSLLFTMKKLNDDITGEGIDTKELDIAFEEAIELINKSISNEKIEFPELSAHNFFKSQKSTVSINRQIA